MSMEPEDDTPARAAAEPAVTPGSEAAPGQIPASVMADLYRVHRIGAETRKLLAHGRRLQRLAQLAREPGDDWLRRL